MKFILVYKWSYGITKFMNSRMKVIMAETTGILNEGALQENLRMLY